MRDANLAEKPMTWDDACKWLEKLNEEKYGGYSDWYLPTTPDAKALGYTDTAMYNVTDSDLGHLFYSGLKLTGKISPDGTPNTTYGLGATSTPFNDLQSGYYWFGSECSIKLNNLPTAWIFDFQHGTQFLATTGNFAYTLAVRSALPAPEPASAVLFLSGLAGTLLYLRRERS